MTINLSHLITDHINSPDLSELVGLIDWERLAQYKVAVLYTLDHYLPDTTNGNQCQEHLQNLADLISQLESVALDLGIKS